MFGILASNPTLQSSLHIKGSEARRLQIESLLNTCRASEKLGFGNDSLAMATYLSDMIPTCQELGLDLEVNIQDAVSDILWSQSEQTASIHMLRSLTTHVLPKANHSAADSATLLAKLVRLHFAINELY